MIAGIRDTTATGEFGGEMPDPMPGSLRWLDDPWGIGWRTMNALRRLSARRAARFAAGYLRDVRHRRPVFVIGAPRSGTTTVFQLLRGSPELGSLPGEGHDIWRALHHPRYAGWRSDVLRAEDVRRGEERYVHARFHVYVDRDRFVEKTPENSLRIPYLLELFPDAFFVAVRRSPCDVISSLINGWHQPAGRYRSYFVPQDLHIPDYPHRRRWCFALIEGWREFASSPIPEIAFAQWDQCTHAIEEGRSLVPAGRWVDLCLEEMLERGYDALRGLWPALGLEEPPGLERRFGELAADPPNSLTRPGRDKWRRDNAVVVEPLLPRIAEAAAGRGYAVDPSTGEVQAVAYG